MEKSKQILPKPSFHERLLQAKGFQHTVMTKPRRFTQQMTNVVRYPKLIYDIARTVDVRRAGDNRFAFELRQKRYLGRGNYAISARAKGFITYDESSQQTHISGFVHLGGHYVTLLTGMTLFVLSSLSLVFYTILYIPLALLMLAVLALHWVYLFADQNDLQEQLVHLVGLTERAERLSDIQDDHESQDFAIAEAQSATKVRN